MLSFESSAGFTSMYSVLGTECGTRVALESPISGLIRSLKPAAQELPFAELLELGLRKWAADISALLFLKSQARQEVVCSALIRPIHRLILIINVCRLNPASADSWTTHSSCSVFHVPPRESCGMPSSLGRFVVGGSTADSPTRPPFRRIVECHSGTGSSSRCPRLPSGRSESACGAKEKRGDFPSVRQKDMSCALKMVVGWF